MAAASDFLEDQILTLVLVTGPAWLALSTANPLDSGAGIAEPVGAGYARKNLAGLFTVTGGGAGTAPNSGVIEFAPATGSWGTITHVAIFDASTGGNMKIHSPIGSPISIGLNQVLRFIVNAFTMTVA